MMQAALFDITKLAILKLLVLVDAIRRLVNPVKGEVVRSGQGDQNTGPRKTLCILAHFDRDGVVDDYVVSYLRALDELGCETVFVSTAENLDDKSVRKIKPFCSKFIIKQNVGYDFASWRTGLAAVGDLSAYDRLIIANDSVYGPLQDLRKIFAEMDSRNIAFWGITDSLKYGRHLQSYFLVYDKPVLQSKIFSEFWRKLPDFRIKYVVIIQGEVGLSRRLVAAGFDFLAYCPIETVQEAQQADARTLAKKFRDPRVSPTHRGWRALMSVGCPFLKVQLLRDNPMQVPDLDDWETVVGEASGYDLDLIRNHLARMKRN